MSTNRPGSLSNRTGTPTQNPPYSNIGSPSLSPKSSANEPVSLSSKNSPNHYPYSSAGNSHTPLITKPRTLPNVPTGDSPSISIPTLTNTNFYNATNQLSKGIKTDTTSLRSEDSATSSEEQFHPISVQLSSSTRIHDISSTNSRYRALQGHPSASTGGNLITHLTNTTSSSTGTTISSATGAPMGRIPSPSPSLLSEREREENERVERELEVKRKRLQIYVFICRCVACPFNSKQSSDMARKHLKITLVQYGVIKERFLAFLNGRTHIEADEGK